MFHGHFPDFFDYVRRGKEEMEFEMKHEGETIFRNPHSIFQPEKKKKGGRNNSAQDFYFFPPTASLSPLEKKNILKAATRQKAVFLSLKAHTFNSFSFPQKAVENVN